VLEAAQIVAGRCPKIQFVFVGDGLEKGSLKKKTQEMRLTNVRFLPRRPHSEIAAILSLADVLLVHLKDDPLFRITIPSKIQAYLAVGKPILVGVRGDANDLVTEAEAGLPCEPENPQSIAEAVEKFQAMPQEELAAMGENGKRFYRQELSLAIGARQFNKIFKALAEKSREMN